MVARDVDDPVVAPAAPADVLPRVVDDVIGAELANQVHLARAAHAGHLRAEGFRDLHGERADVARRTVDQHPLARLDGSSPAAQTLQGQDRRLRHGRRFLEGHAGRLRRPGALRGACILGKGAVAVRGQVPEDLITWLHHRDVTADSLDLPGHVQSQAAVPRPAEPGANTREEGLPVEVVEVGGVQGCRADPHEHVVLPDSRRVDVRELEHVGRAVFGPNDRLHRTLLGCWGRTAYSTRSKGQASSSHRATTR